MPDAWANDAARRAKAGVPETVTFKTKPQIALDQIKWACEAGLPKGVALIDAGYGVEAKFRTGISALDLRYVAGIKSTTNVWAPGTDALPPPVYRGRGRHAVRPVRDVRISPSALSNSR